MFNNKLAKAIFAKAKLFLLASMKEKGLARPNKGISLILLSRVWI